MKIITFFSIAWINCLFSFQLSAQSVYRLTQDSQVKISGTSTLSDWTVTGTALKGQMEFEARNNKKNTMGSVGDGEIAMAEVALDVASIHSERGETMDNRIYKALNRDEFPEIRFRLRDPVQLKKVAQRQASIVADGDLSIAGVTKSISFEMDVSSESEKWIFHGRKSLKMSDFSIEPPSAMFGQIVTGDEIEIDLDLIFK